jgi:nitrous oxide reductase accessory protein NosL
MKELFFAVLLVSALIAFSGCTQPTANAPSPEQLALQECKQVCNAALEKGTDLSKGPCLGNPLPNHSDWACDIANKPRVAVDDLAANQCSSYGKSAQHFVELDTECNLIRLN